MVNGIVDVCEGREKTDLAWCERTWVWSVGRRKSKRGAAIPGSRVRGHTLTVDPGKPDCDRVGKQEGR